MGSARRAHHAVEQRSQGTEQEDHDKPRPAPDRGRLHEAQQPREQGGKDAGEVKHQANGRRLTSGSQAPGGMGTVESTLARLYLGREGWPVIDERDTQEGNGNNAQKCDRWFHADPSFPGNPRQTRLTTAVSSA